MGLLQVPHTLEDTTRTITTTVTSTVETHLFGTTTYIVHSTRTIVAESLVISGYKEITLTLTSEIVRAPSVNCGGYLLITGTFRDRTYPGYQTRTVNLEISNLMDVSVKESRIELWSLFGFTENIKFGPIGPHESTNVKAEMITDPTYTKLTPLPPNQDHWIIDTHIERVTIGLYGQQTIRVATPIHTTASLIVTATQFYPQTYTTHYTTLDPEPFQNMPVLMILIIVLLTFAVLIVKRKRQSIKPKVRPLCSDC
jgi:hypothetical protein